MLSATELKSVTRAMKSNTHVLLFSLEDQLVAGERVELIAHMLKSDLSLSSELHFCQLGNAEALFFQQDCWVILSGERSPFRACVLRVMQLLFF
jgi:hypothetical protein